MVPTTPAPVTPPSRRAGRRPSFRKNGKPWKDHTAGAAVRNDALRSCRRLDRVIWKLWTGYQEAKMHCF